MGPAGTEYTSMMPNMFISEIAFNKKLYAEKGKLGDARDDDTAVAAMYKVSAWRVLRGNSLEK